MRLRILTLTTLVALALLAAPALSSAQERQPAAGGLQTEREPKAGSIAIGGDLGIQVPDAAMHTGFAPDVFGEFYVTNRVSVRLMGGWVRNRIKDTESFYLDQMRGHLNVVYNWEAELWHPFVTAGVGAVGVREYEDEVVNSGWRGRLGANAGLGIEYFAHPTLTYKAEAGFFWVNPHGLQQEAHGFSLSLGIKKYF
jgi:hypothetical protein